MSAIDEGFGPGLDAMESTVEDVMHRGVLVCARDAALSTVAELMATHRVHCVVVSDDPEHAGSLWGVVSDLDLVAAATVRGLDEQTAGASAATEALTISPAETLRRAGQLMTEHGAAHLVVVDPENLRPIGVVSTLDIAAALDYGVTRDLRSRHGATHEIAKEIGRGRSTRSCRLRGRESTTEVAR